MRPGAALGAAPPAHGRCPPRPPGRGWAGWPPGPGRCPPTWPGPGQPRLARCCLDRCWLDRCWLARCCLARCWLARCWPGWCWPGRPAWNGEVPGGAARRSAARPAARRCWTARLMACRMSWAVHHLPARRVGGRTRGDGVRPRMGWARCPAPTSRTAPGHGKSPADQAGCTGGRDRL